ncbi:hypothetical protein [Bacillus sp. 03113]|uniref:hypothetical protein n=1 Tax=Bacillus sp. 03113 TaxID=2578211 RepID=UPI001143B3B1|nr:hypothetical protein [Bacillus sp. 03113]
MIQVVPFHSDSVLHLENCIVMRKNFDHIEFGFPYFDAQPIKLTISDCSMLVLFILNCAKRIDEGEIESFCTRPVNEKVDWMIIIRKTFGDSLHIDFTFTDVAPMIIDLQEVINFGLILNKMLDIKMINSPEEVDR